MRDFPDRRGRRAGRVEPRRLEHHANRHAVLGEGEARRRHEGEAEREQKAMGAAHETLRGLREGANIAPQSARASSRSPSSPAGEEGLSTVAAVADRSGAISNRPLQNLARARAAGGASPTLGHEPLELFAVLSAADRVDIFGELAMRLVELAALFIEPSELRRPPFVESGVAGSGS